MTTLRDQHLADLHQRARELGVPRYRMLPRDELVEAIEAAGGGEGESEERDEAVDAGLERRRSRPRRKKKDAAPDEDEVRDEEPEGRDEEGSDVETEPVTGVLDRMPQGYGFLRLSGMHEAEGDIYVSASQIRRCELRPGDEVSGPARSPRRGERHRALVRVESVNGQDPEADRKHFEDLTPAPPRRRMFAPDAELDPAVRMADLLGPLAFGQRVLILAQPRSGRTTLLRALGSAIAQTEAHLSVLLADERPEEVPLWQEAFPDAEIFAATADEEPREQVREAELAMGHVKRLAESGGDVVVIIDSLSRLALGYRDPGRVKRMFGAGRELGEDGTGSLTVIATVLETDDRGSEVREALETTENVLLRLDADLAAKGVFPPLVPRESRSTGEEELRDSEELEKVRELRAELAEMEPEEGARKLADLIAETANNAELLIRL
jgi:transcription termination factor Rho